VAEKVFARDASLRGRKVAGTGSAPEIIIDESLSSNMIFAGGLVTDPVSKKSIRLTELLEEAYLNRISLSGYGFYRYPGIHFNKETGKGNPFFYFTNGVAVSEVSVNRYTGEIKVLRSDILMDLGRVQNRDIDMGQVTGAFVQGMGWLTTERLFFNQKGQLKTYSPSTYKIPSVHDIPRIFNVEFIENTKNDKNLRGGKAVGEPPLMLAISVWTAVKNALFYTGKTAHLKVPACQESVLMELYR
jgi:xanthine dehydrogenase large subunit